MGRFGQIRRRAAAIAIACCGIVLTIWLPVSTWESTPGLAAPAPALSGTVVPAAACVNAAAQLLAPIDATTTTTTEAPPPTTARTTTTTTDLSTTTTTESPTTTTTTTTEPPTTTTTDLTTTTTTEPTTTTTTTTDLTTTTTQPTTTTTITTTTTCSTTPVPTYPVTISVNGPGTVSPGSGSYNGTVTFAAQPTGEGVFTGWTVDGVVIGYDPTLALPVTRERAVVANFATVPTFCDLTPSSANYAAISNLAARGVIRGSENPTGPGNCFLPNDPLIRIHVAALITRAFGWEGEDHGTTFTDRGTLGDDFWRNAGTLAHYGVAKGYDSTTFDPFGPASHAQAIAFVTRAMVQKGYWTLQADNPAYYGALPAASDLRREAITFQFYAGNIPGTGSPNDPWGGPDGAFGPSSRVYMAQVLWQAYSSYFSTNHIP